LAVFFHEILLRLLEYFRHDLEFRMQALNFNSQFELDSQNATKD